MSLLEIIGSFAPVDIASQAVVAADDTAGTLTIVTKLTAITTIMVSILRSGIEVKEDAVVTASGGSLTITDGGATYALTAGDVIHYILVGKAIL